MHRTMTSQAASEREAERVHVDHGVTKRLGRWTRASQFDVRVRSGVLVLDLRSPEVTGDVEVRLGLHRSTVKLLLAEGDQVDHWELDWAGRGLAGDRRLAVVSRRTGKVASAKYPRLWRDMLTLSAEALDDATARITLPDGKTVSSTDPGVDAVLSGLLGQPVTLTSTPPD